MTRMPIFFVDSSALVKRYRTESGSRHVTSLLEGAKGLIASRLTKVEVASALVRRARGATEPAAAVNEALTSLETEFRDSFDVVELDEPLMEQAAALARKHAVRGADAVQLACLLLARHDYPDSELVLLSADDELNAAAMAEGLRVENPNLQP
jgi:uncharacterized protein